MPWDGAIFHPSTVCPVTYPHCLWHCCCDASLAMLRSLHLFHLLGWSDTELFVPWLIKIVTQLFFSWNMYVSRRTDSPVEKKKVLCLSNTVRQLLWWMRVINRNLPHVFFSFPVFSLAEPGLGLTWKSLGFTFRQQNCCALQWLPDGSTFATLHAVKKNLCAVNVVLVLKSPKNHWLLVTSIFVITR